MPIGNKELLKLTVLTVIAIAGCESNERLAELAQHDLETQHAQNETIARQSTAVVAESQQLAVAAKDLVSQDAKARQELIQAQRELHGQLHEERSGVDRERAILDDERRAIASQRQRDPVIGVAIQGAALVLACLAPLLLAAYALQQLGQANREPPELAEILLTDLSDGHPKLVPWSSAPRLKQADDRSGDSR
jgi:hypothetical protein